MKRVLSEGLLEFDNVFMVESFEYFDFTEDDAFVLLIGIVLFEFFDSDCVMIRDTKV